MFSALFLISCVSFLTLPAIGCGGAPANGVTGDFNITFNINCSAETVTVTIEFSDYDGGWFGVVFGGSMPGNALIYTTGKSGDTVAEGLWPYTISSYSLSSISRDSSSSWDEISTVEDGTTITVEYRQSLSATDWDTTTSSVVVRGAEGKVGNGLTISSKHETRTSSLTLDLSGTTTAAPSPTANPTNSPSASPSVSPSRSPSASPSVSPSRSPSSPPSVTPSMSPSVSPSNSPTITGATANPSVDPTVSPSAKPTVAPSRSPTDVPVTASPSKSPTTPTTAAPGSPSNSPTVTPSVSPTVSTTESDDDDGYELCVEQSGAGDVDLEIYRDADNEMMKIKISGPTDAWFGFGFGSTSMSGTYTVIGSGSSDFDVEERTLGAHASGTTLSSSGNNTVLEDGDSRTLVLEREYDVDGTYDFTDFMDCSTESINVISGYGSSDSFGYHTGGKLSGTASNECCDSDSDTDTDTDTDTDPDTNVSAANEQWGLVAVLVSGGVLLWMR